MDKIFPSNTADEPTMKDMRPVRYGARFLPSSSCAPNIGEVGSEEFVCECNDDNLIENRGVNLSDLSGREIKESRLAELRAPMCF